MIEKPFRALSHPHRRRLLVDLFEEDIQFVDLPVEGELDNASKWAVRKELYETHLPMLENDGFIEWDKRGNLIARGPRFREIESLIRHIKNEIEHDQKQTTIND